MKIKEIHINRFDLGIADEERDLANGFFRYLENVTAGDQFRSIKQTPNTTTTADEKKILAFTDVGGTVYGLGWENATTEDATIYSRTTGAFAAVTNGTAATYNLTDNKPLFVYAAGATNTLFFCSGGYLHGYRTTEQTMATGVNAINLKGGVVWQGNVYGWTGQEIYQVSTNATNAATSKITIPYDQTIIDLLPYGNYLMVICTSSIANSVSKMYVWDGVTTTTFADIVEIGYGDVTGADTLDGIIHAVIGFPNQKGFRIKTYNGNVFRTKVTYKGKKNQTSNWKIAIPASYVKAITGYLYFLAIITRPAISPTTDKEMVLFRYGKKETDRQDALTVYKTTELANSDFSSLYNDFVVVEGAGTGTYDFVNMPETHISASLWHGSDSMTIVTTQVSSNAAVFSSQAGIIETGIYTGGDSSIKKHLKGVSAQFVGLSSSGTVVMKYKADTDTSWTTIFTETTDGAISHEAVNIESSGANLPIFKEIAFRAELTYGAELTGIKILYEDEANVLNN